jgi:predicted CXXCH cytochrome family protein
MQKKYYYSKIIIVMSVILITFIPALSRATITGECSNCHTMHNSQSGTAVDTSGPNVLLLKADCLGCHGMGTSNKIETLGTSSVPQVLHTDASGDLAGGNFAYITGQKGTADDTHGHNVIDLGAAYKEDVLTNPPGAYHSGQVTNDELTCAGQNGCHGIRDTSTSGVSGVLALKGSHHGNVDGQLNTADTVANSYRFLWGVKGYEISNWQNTNSTQHNEYFGATSPMDYNATGCQSCHDSSDITKVKPSNQTISGFCGTCHGNFHLLDGIGGDTNSPFIRHPTDIVLPSSGEFSAYTTYDINAPVARTTVPTSASGTVTPGTDVVMCLSCHKAHATAYPDMLRWDYTTIVTGGSGGCLICHTQK